MSESNTIADAVSSAIKAASAKAGMSVKAFVDSMVERLLAYS
jgi:hypothetical protein